MKQGNNNDVIEIDLLKLLKALWRQIWLIIIAMAICGVSAFSYAQYMLTPLYTSSAMIYVNNASMSLGEGKLSISSADITASQSLVDTYIVILKTRGTLNEVIERADLDYTYEDLSSMIDASAVNSTEVFKVEVTSPDPEEAMRIANTIAEVLPSRIAEIVESTSAKVVDYAVTPARRSFPSLTKYTAIGIIIGAMLSCGFIVLRELFDEQIRSEKDLSERCPEVPVLSVIPDMEDAESSSYSGYYAYGKRIRSDYKKHSDYKSQEEKPKSSRGTRRDRVKLVRDMSFAVQEAYKLLRTNLMFSMPDDQNGRVIGITSALRGDGKSTTSLNLAYTMAEAGKRVLLIEADLRLPTMAHRLGVEKTPGLSNLLVNLAEKDKAIQPSGLQKTLDILVAGDIPPNPSELLGSEQMKKFLKEVSEQYDYVILDLPPVNAVSDGLVISKLVGGMVMVVRQDYDDYRSVNDALRRISYLQCKVLGTVLTCAGVHGGQYNYRYKRYGKYGGYKRYGYRYGGGYKNYSYSYANYGYGKSSGQANRKVFRDAVLPQTEESKPTQGEEKHD